MIGKLIIVRHTESEWNKLGLWTGWTDVHLSEKGRETAKKLGTLLKDYKIDEAVVSGQIRTKETLEGIKTELTDLNFPVSSCSEINERDYGDFTGKNKWEVEKEVGKEKFLEMRRGWDCPIPGGETLKVVYERAVPFYINSILPKLISGKNILMVSHGNSIRAMVKYIENLDDKQIENTEMLFNQIYVYDVDETGHKVDKKVLELPVEETTV